MDETPKYRKKKAQNSKSEKRSDHKHEYVKTIQMSVNTINGKIDGFYWATHCKVCGRLGSIDVHNNDDFRKPEYYGKSRWWSADMYLPFDEVIAKFPDVPVYRTNPNDWKKDVRIR